KHLELGGRNRTCDLARLGRCSIHSAIEALNHVSSIICFRYSTPVRKREEQEGVAATQISQHKARLRECTTQLRNLLASEKPASFKEYLENLDATSETNYSLWRAARNLKRPVEFKPPLRNQWRLGTKRL
ncbi:hypothetical protein EVAR_72052_1, partial [Eumeta japonica]